MLSHHLPSKGVNLSTFEVDSNYHSFLVPCYANRIKLDQIGDFCSTQRIYNKTTKQEQDNRPLHPEDCYKHLVLERRSWLLFQQ